jgi:hypothetical protein
VPTIRQAGSARFGHYALPVSGRDDALAMFTEAAISWAAGGRGQPLVDAAAAALAAGLDSPTLRVLAGAPRAAADEEATELAPTVFEELGMAVAERLSPEAVVQGARQRARRFVAEGGSPRALTADLYGMFIAAGYPDELTAWTGLDDWYDMVATGVIAGTTDEVDAAAVEAAHALAEGREPGDVPLGQRFLGEPGRRSWVRRILGRST